MIIPLLKVTNLSKSYDNIVGCKNIDNLKAIKRYITRTKIDINEVYNPIDEEIFTQMKSENLFLH